jgi:signal transduction histidine kinase
VTDRLNSGDRAPEELLPFLLEASALLGASLEVEAILQALTRLAVPRLADWCTIDLLDADNLIHRVAAAHVDPTTEVAIRETLRRHPMRLEEPRGVAVVLRTGQSNLHPTLTDADVQRAARDAAHLAFLQSLQPRSHLIAPMLARGRRVGALSCLFGPSGRHYTAADVPIVESLATQAAIALDNARLYGEARAAEGQLQLLNTELEGRVAARAADLEAANRELEAFTYTVSHDLRAPLRGIEGFARALQEDYGPVLDPTAARYVTMIQTSAVRMGDLISDLLRYARLDRRAFAREPVALRPLLDRICADLAEEIDARAITLQWDLVVATVAAEPEGLQAALMNLIGNAVKFSPRTGGVITMASRQDGATVLLSISDTGIGFDMKYHDRIFRMFERLHVADEYPGTGVGLAIVRKVADRHGGRVWADSRQGHGTTFFLGLPDGGGPLP